MKKHMGKTLRIELARAGMKQKVLAEKMGCSAQHITGLLRRAQWHEVTVHRVVTSLGINVDIFYREGTDK